MIKGSIQKFLDGMSPQAAFGQEGPQADLARGLLATVGSRNGSRRIGLLVKNLNMSGGNRVIMNLFDRLTESEDAEVHVFVVPEAKRHLGELFSLAACKRRYGAAASVRRATRPIDPSEFDALISTSRRTLDFVADLDHPAHFHLLQAVEVWDTLNSAEFLNYCGVQGYPGPEACIDVIREIGLPQDVRYVGQIAATRRFLTVSEYLELAARYLGCAADDIIVREPIPNIRGASRVERTIDLLLFLRGFSYNGDDLAVALANALADKPYRVAVVAGRRAKPLVKTLIKRGGLSVVYDPPDEALAELFAATRVVAHPSLHNGGGFIPIEALCFGCSVVASRTGWLLTEGKGRLTVVERHDPVIYLAEIERILETETARPLAVAV